MSEPSLTIFPFPNNSEVLGRIGVYIPIGNHLSKSKQKFISEKLIEAVNKYN